MPGFNATRLAKALSQMGLGSSVINADVPGGDNDTASAPADSEPDDGEPPAGESRRLRVLAHMTMNELDAADALAVEAIAAGDEVADMHHQRAMIALMRGDEDAALAQLAQVDTPQARSSRAPSA